MDWGCGALVKFAHVNSLYSLTSPAERDLPLGQLTFSRRVGVGISLRGRRTPSRGTLPILSRDPSFQKSSGNPGRTAGFWKERCLKRMGNQSTPRLIP